MDSRLARNFLLAGLLLGPTLHAGELTREEARKLQEQLEELEEEAQADARGRYQEAYQAFRKAMSSEAAAIELYRKCLEKVEFADKGRSSSEFRQWDRRSRDRLKEEGLRRALQHQLNWLVLTLEVERSEKEPTEFAPAALGKFSAMVADMPKLAGYESTLREPVTSSVFARAYEVDRLTREAWPQHPLDIESIFDQLAIPAAKAEEKTGRVRELWEARIEFESRRAKFWGKGALSGDREQEESLQRQMSRFREEALPRLHWRMENSCFECGDESLAARNMLRIIDKHRGHKDREQWIQELKTLTQPLAEEPKKPAKKKTDIWE